MNISVIGTGYVGLASGTCFAEMGNRVICVDNDPKKLEKLQNAELTIFEPGLDLIFYRNIAKKRLEFTGDIKYAIINSDIVFFCLPTPQGEDGSADLHYIMNAAEQVSQILLEEKCTDYKVIVNKSTVPVGTGSVVEDIFIKHGIHSVDIVSNPEFLREGFAVEDFMKPDRIVIGTESPKAIEKMKQLYEPFVRQGNPILIMDRPSAEVTKYAANSYLAMRITYMNELANFCEVVGANVDLVRKGMGTDSRIGKRFLFPGIGYGGSCFPKDVKALIKTSIEHNSQLNVLQTVDEMNKKQKLVLVNKVLNYFNNDIKGKHFAIWGLAFKPNTDDMREAPSVIIIKKLLELGATVCAYDPAANETADFYFKGSIAYSDNEYTPLENADALLILTEWNEFRNPNFDLIKSTLKNSVIFDGRNVFDIEKMSELDFDYFSIGRKAVLKK